MYTQTETAETIRFNDGMVDSMTEYQYVPDAGGYWDCDPIVEIFLDHESDSSVISRGYAIIY